MKNIHPHFFFIFFFKDNDQCRRFGGGGGGRDAVPPPYWLLVPPFWFTKNTVFGTSHNDKTTDSDGKIAVHKPDTILRLNNTPLRMCPGRVM